MCRLCAAAVVVAVCSASVAVRATSYEPVTFNDLVTRADVIFVGEVIDVRPFAVNSRDSPIIKTRVVFRVSDPVWGTTAALEVFEFLGGEWGGVGLAVAEMPKFAVGDRRVVFARRERSINPIVGFTQGLLQITRDVGGIDRVSTHDGLPLARPESIGHPPVSPVEQAVPMRLSEFRDRLRGALAEARRR